MQERYPFIALVGRPNVGKSTLFNRLIGRRHAVTSQIPGTTRDRLYHLAQFDEFPVMLVDTGGLDFGKHENIEKQVQIQAKVALADADIIYFLIDASEPLTGDDFEAAKTLRKTKKPVLLLAHKSDRKRVKEHEHELYKLGFGEALAISSIHGQGVEDLVLRTVGKLKDLRFHPVEKKSDEGQIRLGLLGRPNVGKSTLLNRLLGEERAIVSGIPGTTRDIIDSNMMYRDKKFTLLDTAGIRRRGKVEPGLEKFSVFRALDAVYRCDIAVLLIDFAEGITNQDCHVSEFVLEAGKGLIIAINKCDLMQRRKEDEAAMINLLNRKMNYVPWAPVIFLSAKEGKNIEPVLDLACRIRDEQLKKIPDPLVQRFVEQAALKHPPASKGANLTRIFGGRQIRVDPPTFLIQTNHPDNFHFSYVRYLENALREKFSFAGTSVRLQFTSRPIALESKSRNKP